MSSRSFSRRVFTGPLAVGVFCMICAVLGFGGRVGDATRLEGFVRSMHLLDLLIPLLVIILAVAWKDVTAVVGDRTIRAIVAWCGYALVFSFLGYIIVGEYYPDLLTASFLFAVKEIEFALVFLFAAWFSYLRPVSAARTVDITSIFLVIWAAKEIVRPTGFYYVGLPFEAGPSQTGAVYAIFALCWLYSSLTSWFRLSTFRRILTIPILMGLLTGNVLSFSRTGQAALAIGIAILILFYMRSFIGVILATIIVVSTYVLMFGSNVDVAGYVVADRWAAAVDNFPDRVFKWRLMFDFQLNHPWTIIFGCGFASPNFFVLNRFAGIDLGYVLAVDNGYVRRIFEVGLLGSFLYFALLYRIIVKIAHTPSRAIGFAGTASFLTISIAIEGFQVTQIAGAYFLFAGFLIGTSKRLALVQRTRLTSERLSARAA